MAKLDIVLRPEPRRLILLGALTVLCAILGIAGLLIEIEAMAGFLIPAGLMALVIGIALVKDYWTGPIHLSVESDSVEIQAKGSESPLRVHRSEVQAVRVESRATRGVTFEYLVIQRADGSTFELCSHSVGAVQWPTVIQAIGAALAPVEVSPALSTPASRTAECS